MSLNVAGQRDIGSLITVKVLNKPNAVAAGTRDSASYDRATLGNPLSCVLFAASGPVTGGPTAQTLDAKIQHSDDNSVFTDFDPPGPATAAITQITAANTEAFKDVDLATAKRYVRVREVVAFTGGASPTLGATSGLVLGGYDTYPQS